MTMVRHSAYRKSERSKYIGSSPAKSKKYQKYAPPMSSVSKIKLDVIRTRKVFGPIGIHLHTGKKR